MGIAYLAKPMAFARPYYLLYIRHNATTYLSKGVCNSTDSS